MHSSRFTLRTSASLCAPLRCNLPSELTTPRGNVHPRGLGNRLIAGIRGKSWSIPELEEAGVRRVSVATSIFRAAMTGVLAAGREILEDGTFGYLDDSVTSSELARFLR